MPSCLPQSSRKALDHLIRDLFYCPGCSAGRLSRASSSARKRVPRRYNSTLASNTAVHATKKVPTRYRELYDALQDVQKKAPAEINLSRLQLALAGLETERLTTRVALLGIDQSTTARRVVRLLLADSLKQEESWERRLDDVDRTGSEGVLIRYGAIISPSLQPSRTAIPTISIPSPLLQQNNIEILISSVAGQGSGNASATESDAFLTPFIDIPTSASGRQTIVNFPVHKTIILANGLDEFQELSRILALTQYTASSEKVLIASMVNLDGTATLLKDGKIMVLDISRVGEDLKQMRKDLGHAPAFEVSWTGSGLPVVARWMAESALSSEGKLPATLSQYIQALLDGASANMRLQDEAASVAERAATVDLDTRAKLEEAIDAFLAQAHRELQTGLVRAFESRSWRKLAWYKLLWRADDVPLIVTDLTQQYWLRESSVVVFEMLGRLHQAGLVNFVSYDGNVVEFVTTDGEELPPYLRPKQSDSTSTDYLEDPGQPTLKSSELSRARESFLEVTIPTMTATAQRALFKAIGFSTASAGLSVLAYVSTVTPSLYECGAILALGLVFSLRRLQKEWETYRSGFTRDIFAVGRDALKSTEAFMRLAVRDGGKQEVDEAEVQARNEASAAIERARQALEKLD